MEGKEGKEGIKRKRKERGRESERKREELKLNLKTKKIILARFLQTFNPTLSDLFRLKFNISVISNSSFVKGNTKFWYWVVNLFQINILEAYAIQQYLLIVVAVEIDSKVMKL